MIHFPLDVNYGRKTVDNNMVVTQAMGFSVPVRKDNQGVQRFAVMGLVRLPNPAIRIPRHVMEIRLDPKKADKPRGTKRQRRGSLTNDQLWMLSVAGGYSHKYREVIAKRMGCTTCRHQPKSKNTFSRSVPASDAVGSNAVQGDPVQK